MEALAISIDRDIWQITESLEKELRSITSKNKLRRLDKEDTGDLIVFRCINKVKNNKEASDSFYHQIAEVLTDIIICNLETILIDKIVRDNYICFDDEERENILLHTINLINSGAHGYTEYYSKRKDSFYKSIMEYAAENSYMNLLGFIRFRVKEYVNCLTHIINEAVDDYIIKREQEEFIYLLKHFVNSQIPQTGKINVIIQESGLFKLVDSYYNVIDNEYLSDFIPDVPEDEIDYDDLLLSALITVAPKSIVIHLRKDKEIINTILNVFEDRVTLCYGCNMCSGEKGLKI